MRFKFWRPVLFFQAQLRKSENHADCLLIDSIRLAKPNTAQWSPAIPALLDTGSTDLMVPIGLARTLELPIGDLAPARFANGQLTQVPTIRADINFNGLQLANVECGIGPDEVPLLVGMNILRYFDVRICDGHAQFTVNENIVSDELEAFAKPRVDEEE